MFESKNLKHCYQGDVLLNSKMNFSENIKNANLVLKNKFKFTEFRNMEKCQAIVDLNPLNFQTIYGNDVEWTYALVRMPYLIDLAIAYKVKGEQKYLNKIFQLLQLFSLQEPCIESNYSTTWRTIDAAIRALNLLKTWALLKKDCDETSQEKLWTLINIHFDYLWKAFDEFSLNSNWGLMQTNALLSIYALNAEHFGQKINLSELVLLIEQQIDLQFRIDGSHWEQSTMYHGEVLWNVLNIIYVLQALNQVSLSELVVEKIHQAFIYLETTTKPNNKLLLKGDTDEIDISSLMLCYSAILTTNVDQRYFSRQAVQESLLQFGINNFNLNQQKNNQSMFFAQAGDYIFKNQNIYFHFNLGAPAGHGHFDFQQINYYYQSDWVIDSGRYTYVFEKGRAEFKSENAHSKINILNDDLHQVNSWAIDADLQYESAINQTKNFWLMKTIDNTHLATQGLSTSRKVLVNEEKYVVVLDKVIGDQNKTNFEINWISPQDNLFTVFKTEGTLQNTPLIYQTDFQIKTQECEVSKQYNTKEKAFAHKITNFSINAPIISFWSLTPDEIRIQKIPVFSYRNKVLDDDHVLGFLLESKNFKEYLILKLKLNQPTLNVMKINNLLYRGNFVIVDDDNYTELY